MEKSESGVKEHSTTAPPEAEARTEDESKRRGRVTKERIQKLLDDIEDRLQAESAKTSIADYIRLLQLERELEEEDEAPRELRVTWVDPGRLPSDA